MSLDMKQIYEEKLEEVRETIKALNRLMQSEKDDVILQAVGLYLDLVDLELALVYALDEAAESQEKNPLVRRLRLDK